MIEVLASQSKVALVMDYDEAEALLRVTRIFKLDDLEPFDEDTVSSIRYELSGVL